MTWLYILRQAISSVPPESKRDYIYDAQALQYTENGFTLIKNVSFKFLNSIQFIYLVISRYFTM